MENEKRIDDTFVIFTNVNEDSDHSRDSVLVQALGKSFGMFDMTSIHGVEAYELYKHIKDILKGK